MDAGIVLDLNKLVAMANDSGCLSTQEMLEMHRSM